MASLSGGRRDALTRHNQRLLLSPTHKFFIFEKRSAWKRKARKWLGFCSRVFRIIREKVGEKNAGRREWEPWMFTPLQYFTPYTFQPLTWMQSLADCLCILPTYPTKQNPYIIHGLLIFMRLEKFSPSQRVSFLYPAVCYSMTFHNSSECRWDEWACRQ